MAVKTIASFFVLALTALAALAQSSPSNTAPVAPTLPANREAEIRKLLDRAYSDMAAPAAPTGTGAAPARATTPPSAVPPTVPTVSLKAGLAATNPVAAPANVPVVPAVPATNVAGMVGNPPPPEAMDNPALPVPPTPPMPTVAAPSVRTAATTNAPPVPAPSSLSRTAAGDPRSASVSNAATRIPPRVRPSGTTPPPPSVGPTAGGATALPGASAGSGARTNISPRLSKAVEQAAGTEPAEGEDIVIKAGEIQFQETDLSQVLEIYQLLTGRTVLRPQNLPQAKITIRTQTELTRKEAIHALDSILSMNGITMVPQGEKFVKAVQTTEVNQAGMVFYDADPTDLPEAGVYVSYIAKLKYVDPTEITQALQPFASKAPQSILAIKSTQTLILRDYAENVKRMLDLIRAIDVYVPADIKPVVIPIKYALASDIAQVLSSLTAGGGGGVTSVGQRPQAQRFATAGGGGGTGTLPGYTAPGSTGINPLGATSSTMGGAMGTGTSGYGGQRSSFSSRLQNIVNRAVSATGEIIVLGQTKIIADERTNALLIFASEEDIKTIKDIISKLDVVLAQVLIEAVILEVNLDDDFRLAVSAAQKDQQAGKWNLVGGYNNASGYFNPTNALGFINPGDITGLPGGFTYFAKYKDEFGMLVQAVSTDSRVKVLSRPRIQTSHAVPCRIFIGETRPYPTGSSYGGYYGGYSSISQLRIGIELNVLPLINPDGLVVMDIDQRVDSSDSTVKLDNVGEVPVTKERSANAKVSVRDGETIILGGFIGDTKSKNKSGVPYLKDLPLFGVLFRSTSDRTTRREIIILIRPKVLPSPEDAAIVATEERGKLPGIVEAEREFSKDDIKRQKKDSKSLYKREGY